MMLMNSKLYTWSCLAWWYIKLKWKIDLKRWHKMLQRPFLRRLTGFSQTQTLQHRHKHKHRPLLVITIATQRWVRWNLHEGDFFVFPPLLPNCPKEEVGVLWWPSSFNTSNPWNIKGQELTNSSHNLRQILFNWCGQWQIDTKRAQLKTAFPPLS